MTEPERFFILCPGILAKNKAQDNDFLGLPQFPGTPRRDAGGIFARLLGAVCILFSNVKQEPSSFNGKNAAPQDHLPEQHF
jgi:hypothetical protein